MNILYIGVFKPHCSDQYRIKGFGQAGISYCEIDFRDFINASEDGFRFLEYVRTVCQGKFKPDLVMVNKGERITAQTIKAGKEIVGDSVPWVLFYGDKRSEWPKHLTRVLKSYDSILINSNDMKESDQLYDLGAKHVIYHHSGTDLEIFKKCLEVGEDFDVGFFGGNYETSFPESKKRRDWLMKLCDSGKYKVLIYGANWGVHGKTPSVYGINFSYQASRCKILVGFNAFNDINLYTSNRTFNSMACGFYMSHIFKGCTDLFQDHVHLSYFDNYNGMLEIIDHYLNNPLERKRIFVQGRIKLEQSHTYKVRAMELKKLIQ